MEWELSFRDPTYHCLLEGLGRLRTSSRVHRWKNTNNLASSCVLLLHLSKLKEHCYIDNAPLASLNNNNQLDSAKHRPRWIVPCISRLMLYLKFETNHAPVLTKEAKLPSSIIWIYVGISETPIEYLWLKLFSKPTKTKMITPITVQDHSQSEVMIINRERITKLEHANSNNTIGVRKWLESLPSHNKPWLDDRYKEQP